MLAKERKKSVSHISRVFLVFNDIYLNPLRYKDMNYNS